MKSSENEGEVILEQLENLLIKTDKNITLYEKASLTLTSTKIFLSNEIIIPYPLIIYHALNKESKYVILSCTQNPNKKVINQKILIYFEKIEEAQEVFNCITTGLQSIDDYNSKEDDDYIDNIKIEYINEKDQEELTKEMIEELNEEYEPYNYTNTVDKLFKLEKIKKKYPIDDKRRFEDAD